MLGVRNVEPRDVRTSGSTGSVARRTEMQVCGNCYYAKHEVNDDGSVTVFCRRYPPQQSSTMRGQTTLQHGEVFGMDWCGEYKESDVNYQQLLDEAAARARKN